MKLNLTLIHNKRESSCWNSAIPNSKKNFYNIPWGSPVFPELILPRNMPLVMWSRGTTFKENAIIPKPNLSNCGTTAQRLKDATCSTYKNHNWPWVIIDTTCLLLFNSSTQIVIPMWEELPCDTVQLSTWLFASLQSSETTWIPPIIWSRRHFLGFWPGRGLVSINSVQVATSTTCEVR